jgi:hypothetical protein
MFSETFCPEWGKRQTYCMCKYIFKNVNFTRVITLRRIGRYFSLTNSIEHILFKKLGDLYETLDVPKYRLQLDAGSSAQILGLSSG